MSKMARAEEQSAFGRFRSGFGDSIPRHLRVLIVLNGKEVMEVVSGYAAIGSVI